MPEQNFNQQAEWITAQIENLKKLFSLCKQRNETILCMYIEAVLRLLNTLAAIPFTSLHSYEKQMFWKPMRVFAELFYLAVDEAYKCTTAKRKQRLICEIEFGVKNVVNIYQSLIDATSNTDREMVVNPTLEAHIFEVSPKISLYYAKLLDEISKTLTETENYAFILAPSLQTKVETYELFDSQIMKTRLQDNERQLIVIFIPESIIDQVDIIPVALFHEVYHFLTSVERNRNLRAECLLKQMIYGVVQLVFRFKKIQLDPQTISLIHFSWFASMNKHTLNVINNGQEELYFDTVARMYYKEFNEALLKAYSLEGIEDKILDKNITDYAELIKYRKKVKDVSSEIRENIVTIFSKNLIAELLKTWIYIYKEAYADLMMVLTMNLSPKEYDSAFDLLTTVYCYDKFPVWNDLMRQYCVSGAVYSYLQKYSNDSNKAKEWGEYRKKLHDIFNNDLNEEDKKKLFTDTSSILIIQSQDGTITDNFDKYFEECAESFYNKIRRNNSWERLQKIISKTKRGRNITISDILLDRFFDKGDESSEL